MRMLPVDIRMLEDDLPIEDLGFILVCFLLVVIQRPVG